MDLTLLEGSSWLRKALFFVFFCFFSPKQKCGRSMDREVAVAFLRRAECSGSFAALAPRGLGQPHECLVWCRLGVRLSHPSCAGLVTPAGMSLIFWKVYHEVTSGDSCVGRCSANPIMILPWHA